MGLALIATGYSKTVHCGYLHFSRMRQGIAAAYSEKHGRLYDDAISFKKPIDFDKIVEEWNDGCNDDLDVLLWHCDCSGSLSYQECRKILKVLKTLNVVYEDVHMQNLYKEFYLILEHCAKRRVKMNFC